jgi:hypothetical protein
MDVLNSARFIPLPNKRIVMHLLIGSPAYFPLQVQHLFASNTRKLRLQQSPEQLSYNSGIHLRIIVLLRLGLPLR